MSLRIDRLGVELPIDPAVHVLGRDQRDTREQKDADQEPPTEGRQLLPGLLKEEGLGTLIHMSRQKRTAIMCAEAVPWRCHRSLVADALSVRGIPAVEILSESSYRMHKLTSFAQVDGMRITYPPGQATVL